MTSDHYQMLTPLEPPVDANGIATITGRGHLRDRHQNVVGEIVVRAPWTKQAQEVGLPPGDFAVRIVGPDGTVWARVKGDDLVFEFNPDASRLLRILIAANMICGKADERLHMPFSQGGYNPPEPLEPMTEPYLGYHDVHSSYMQYQEEFIEWYQKRIALPN